MATNPTRSFLMFCAVAAAAGVLAFVLASGLLDAWSGKAVSVSSVPTGTTAQVLIVGDNGREWVKNLPVAAIAGHDLAVNRRAVPILPLPEDAPVTSKTRFRLYFLMQNASGSSKVHYLTSVRTVSVGFLVSIVLVFGRNMVIGGSPLNIVPRKTELPKKLPTAGQVTPRKASRPKKGPPPPRRRSRRR